MNRTTIEWCTNEDGTQGFTWNPVTGCKHGCSYCYARKIATRFKGSKAFPEGFEPTWHPDRLMEPWSPRNPSRIFVCSMADLFGEWVPRDWIDRVLWTVKGTARHTYIFLTKNPKRLKEFNPWPKNAWVGCTITSHKDRDSVPLDGMQYVDAPVKFISFEPLLNWQVGDKFLLGMSYREAGISWLIVGAQTNPTKLPERAWVENIEDAAGSHVAIFEKNSLAPLFPDRPLRQEFPKEKK